MNMMFGIIDEFQAFLQGMLGSFHEIEHFITKSQTGAAGYA